MLACEKLASAIVLMAVKDYRQALKKLRQHPERRSAQAAVNEMEKFFRSEWYRTLTTIDGDSLMRKLKEEVLYR